MNAETVELLTKYGGHNPSCDPKSQHNANDCACGFNGVRREIMATYTAPPPATDAPEAGAELRRLDDLLHTAIGEGEMQGVGQQLVQLATRLRAEVARVAAERDEQELELDAIAANEAWFPPNQLTVMTTERDDATRLYEDIADKNKYLRANLAAEREAHEVTAVALSTTTEERNHAFTTGLEYASRLEAEREHTDVLAHRLLMSAETAHIDDQHNGDFMDCKQEFCRVESDALRAHDARREKGADGE